MLWKTLKNNHGTIDSTINIDVNEKKYKPDHEDDSVWQKNITFIITIFQAPIIPIMLIMFYMKYYIDNLLPYTANSMIIIV